MILGQALLSLGLLYAGGELLTRGASTLAARLGVSKMAIGLTVVAFGTSTPELVVSVDAALAGANGISLGNVIGSNIANVALILGIAGLIAPLAVEARIVRVHVPLMVAASAALVWMLVDQTLARTDGAMLLLGLVAYLVFTFREPLHATETARPEFEAAVPAVSAGLLPSIAATGAGVGLLVGGGHLLVGAAVGLATAAGISEAVIGLTIVAVGTSLPEITATVVAARRGHGDIAIGNVVGSNLFNVLGILGITSALRPLRHEAHGRIDLVVMVSAAAALWALLVWRHKIGRGEGVVLCCVYTTYIAWLIAARA